MGRWLKRIAIAIVLLLVLLAAAGGALWEFERPLVTKQLGGLSLFGFVLVPKPVFPAPPPPAPPRFIGSGDAAPPPIDTSLIYHVPLLIGTVFSSDGHPHMVRLQIQLVMHEPGDNAYIGDYLPRLRDALEDYLHDDVSFDRSHPIDIDQLRQDLLPRFNAVIQPAKLTDILVDSLVLQ